MNNSVKIFILSSAICLSSNTVWSADIAMNTARMQAMDKITGHVSELDVPVNGLANFGTFSILVRKCVTKSPEETPENTAFVDVVDNYQSSNPVNIFKGWMFSSTPALNAVEHPIYDIWLLQCYNRKQNQDKILDAEQLSLRDSIPMKRHKKHEQNIRLSIIEETEDVTSQPETATTKKESTAQVTETENVNIDISSSPQDSAENTNNSDEFVSEGEENLSDAPSPDMFSINEEDDDNEENESNYEVITITE